MYINTQRNKTIMDCLAFYMSGVAAGAGMTVTVMGLMAALGYIQVNVQPRTYDIIYMTDDEDEEYSSDDNCSEDELPTDENCSEDDETDDGDEDDWLSREIGRELKSIQTTVDEKDPSMVNVTAGDGEDQMTTKQNPLPYRRGRGKYCVFDGSLDYSELYQQKTPSYLTTS